MCRENVSKYQCPACNAVTCGLKCCKDHKIKYLCSGIAPTSIEFVALKEFSDKQINEDYQFLVEAEQTSEKAKRMFGKDFGGVYVDRTKKKRRKGSKQINSDFKVSPDFLARNL